MVDRIKLILIDANSLFLKGFEFFLKEHQNFMVLSTNKSIDTINPKLLVQTDIIIQNLTSEKNYQKAHEASSNYFDLSKVIFLVDDDQLGDLDSPHLISVFSNEFELITCVESIYKQNLNYS